VIKWLLLGGAIVSEVTATLSLKGALHQPVLYVVVAVGYPASFWFLTAVLRLGVSLGVAYGIWSAIGVAATAVLSALIFGEPLTPLMGVGLGLVMVGVLVVELGSQAAQEQQS
jgi:small multidrug resistance pump